MKTIGGSIVIAVLLALVSVVAFTAWQLDRDLANAEQRAVTADYQPLMNALETAEPYYEYASRLPWIGAKPLNDLRARKAALHYWQRHYAALISNQEDPFATIPADNVDLQFLVAGAIYRQGVARAKDRTSTIEALDAGIAAYLNVLKNAERHEDAAHNYEYLVRVRNELSKGQRKVLAPREPEDPRGTAGSPQEQRDSSSFKLYIPLEEGERTKEGEAGKTTPIKRKG